MSGSGISLTMHYPTLAEAEQIGIEFFDYLGVKSLEEAKAIESFELMKKMYEFQAEGQKKGFPRWRWGIVVDGVFMPDNPTELLKQNKRLPVPLMAGHTTGDMGDLFSRAPSKEAIRDQILAIAGEEGGREVLAAADYENADLDALKAALSINGQRFSVELMHMRAVEDGLTDYFYSFGPEIPGWDNPGAFHSSDLWFVFETLAKCWRPFVGKHYDLARQMCNYWTNFAKTGDPNGLDQNGTPMPRWEAFTNEAPYSMNFEDTSYFNAKPELPAVKLLLEKAADKAWRK